MKRRMNSHGHVVSHIDLIKENILYQRLDSIRYKDQVCCHVYLVLCITVLSLVAQRYD